MAHSTHAHGPYTASPACCPPKPEHPLLWLTKRVSGVFLGAVAAYTDMQLFLPFLGLGIAVRVYQIVTNSAENVSCGGTSGCGGILPEALGINLPPLIVFFANLAIMYCHIDHHPTIFIPIIGLWMGAWAAQLSGKAIQWLRPQQNLQHQHI